MAQSNRINLACKAAGISRYTAWKWRLSAYISEQELEDARIAYEEVVKSSLWANWYVHHGRFAENIEDPFDSIDTRSLWRIARSVLPEYGGRVFGVLQFSTRGWTPYEIQEVREHIIQIQRRHKDSQH